LGRLPLLLGLPLLALVSAHPPADLAWALDSAGGLLMTWVSRLAFVLWILTLLVVNLEGVYLE
jgi:hypothetical protein